MDKLQARHIVEETFEGPFDKGQFTNFIKNLLNNVQDAPFTYQGNIIPDSFKPYVSIFERIGKYSDGENKVDILVVKLKKETSIERARTMQRNFVAWYLNGSRGGELKDAALTAFVSPDAEDWRFSLVKMDYRFEQGENGKIKVKEEFTPARRWSFLVGKNENSHTAQSKLAPIMEDDEHNPTLSELEDAFNIEKVTREFFEKYRGLFIWTKEELDAIVSKDKRIRDDFDAKGVNTVDFAKKLLGQIIFLYFLQKKGWFGVNRDSEWGTGSKHFLRELFIQKHGKFSNFFNDILEPLFYEALRKDRTYDDDYYSKFNCKIPFLNGGLFDPMGNYDWVHTDILLPNELFSNDCKTKEGDIGSGIIDVFDRYNFTVKEDEPLEKEVAIDPELLGKAYEKFNAIRPDNFHEYLKTLKGGKKGEESKFNKQYGVYYTPREIVHYMCQQSLINYLFTELNNEPISYEKLGDKKLDLFGNEIKNGQLDLTVEHREKPAVPKEDIEKLIHHGESVSENEARVQNKGKETDTYYFKMPETIRANAERIDQYLASIKVCDPAIGSGAFPVGMMSEIVKARNTLTAYIQTPERSPYHFKRDCIENSLYGVDIDSGAVEIAKLRLWLSLMVDEEDIKRIKPLPNLDYKVVCGNSLIGFPENWDSPIEKEIESLKHEFFNETNPNKKNELKRKIDEKIKFRYASSLKSIGYKVDFDFKTVFSEVFHYKKGFDVVIANPPYVRQEAIKELKPLFKDMYECFTGVADLFIYFYEKGFRLLNPGGVLTFISSNKYFRSGYGEKLRAYFGSKATVVQLIDFGDAPIFDAIAYPSIAIIKKEQASENAVTRVFNWETGPEVTEFERVFKERSFEMPQTELRADGWRLENRATLGLLDKLRKAGKPLGEYVDGKFYRGILTGLNEAFVVDRETRDRLIKEHKSSEEVLKPFLRGRDVKRWIVSSADLWLIYVPWHFPLHLDDSVSGVSKKAEKIFEKEYPAIYNHLTKHKKKLSGRNEEETGIRYEWYALQRWGADYWQEFEQPKIIYPNICKRNEFAWDENKYYTNQKAFIIPNASKELLGTLNSNIIFWLFDKLLSKLQNDFFEPSSIFIKDFPIVTGSKLIGTIVKDILHSKQINNSIDIHNLESRLDALVAHLYNLTFDEYTFILNDLKIADAMKSACLAEYKNISAHGAGE